MNAPKQEVINDTVEWTVPDPREGPGQPKLWVYWLKPCMTEEAQGTLNSPCISWSSLVRNLRWPWKSWLNKFYSLLRQEHFTLFFLLL
jgi:hypothetical protein